MGQALARFEEPLVEIEHREGGVVVLRSTRGLANHPRTIVDWLAHWAAERPEQTVLAERDAAGAWRRISYSDAFAKVRSLATALIAAGAGPERPLAILSENSIEQALMTWAAHWAGVPVAPVSPAYSLAAGALERFRAVVELVQPWIVFAQDGARFARGLEMSHVPSERHIIVSNASESACVFDELALTPAAPEIDVQHHARDTNTTAKYMFTSGSTGIPKAVVTTHAQLVAAQEMTAQIVLERPSKTMVQVDWLPWHHVMGGNVVLGRLLRFGGTLYIDDGRPLPGRFERTLRNLREVAPTYYFNVPAGYGMLVAEMERDPAFAKHVLGEMEFAYFSGAAMPASMYERFQQVALDAVGRRIVIGTAYAATETTAAVLIRTWESENPSCIGVPLPGCEVKLIPDPGMPGRYEMRSRGPHISGKYLKAPGASAAARDEEGYYRLGDAARFVDPERPNAGLLFGGRFAEDFKLGSGTWVRTADLRSKLLAASASLLREAVIVGEGREEVTALAWLDIEASRLAAGLDAALDEAAVASHPAVRVLLENALDRLNDGKAASSLRVERMMLQTEPLSLDSYELTDKGSVNQRAVMQHRSAEIEKLYLPTPPAEVLAATPASIRKASD